MVGTVANNPLILPQHLPAPSQIDLHVSNRQLQTTQHENPKTPKNPPLQPPINPHLTLLNLPVHILTFPLLHKRSNPKHPTQCSMPRDEIRLELTV